VVRFCFGDQVMITRRDTSGSCGASMKSGFPLLEDGIFASSCLKGGDQTDFRRVVSVQTGGFGSGEPVKAVVM